MLYHVTDVDSALTIVETGGVNPAYSRGKRSVVWLTTISMVTWAIAHTLNRHNLGLPDSVVLTVVVHPSYRIRTNVRGIWCVDRVCPVEDWTYAAEWLDRAELKVYIPSGIKKRAFRYGYRTL